MNNRTTISTTDARKKLFSIVDEVDSPNVVYTLTERGRPKAVIISADEYESMVETLEVKAVFPNLLRDLKKSEKEFHSGKYTKLSDLKINKSRPKK